jgi:serine-type D-Ala-D-Ala carboxypeptidase
MELRRGIPEDAGMSAQRVQRIAHLAEGWVTQGITPALVVLVARRGVIVLHEAFGRLTPEPDSPPLQRDTIYPLTSITKPITATAAMILVEEGLLGLSRPVSEYIPEFTGEGKDAVKVHHLVTHTSGIRAEDVDAHAARKLGLTETEAAHRPYPGCPRAYAGEKKGAVAIPPPEETAHPTIHEYLYLRYDTPLGTAPGVELSYNNFNYVLLGEIIRRVSGKSLADFARERIIEPLGMNDTSYVLEHSMRRRLVGRPPDASCADWISLELPGGNSGAVSTVRDMAIFGQMFLNHGRYGDARILSIASVAEMTRNQIPGVVVRSGDKVIEVTGGFGWVIRGNDKSLAMLPSREMLWAGGAGGVFMWVDPIYEIVGIYFSVLPAKWTWPRDLFADAVTAAVVDV